MSPLSRGITVSAAAIDEGIGAPCFHRDDAVFFEAFFLNCVLLVDVHSAQALLKCFLSDINNIKDSSFLRKAKLGRTLPFDECGVYLNFKMI